MSPHVFFAHMCVPTACGPKLPAGGAVPSMDAVPLLERTCMSSTASAHSPLRHTSSARAATTAAATTTAEGEAEKTSANATEDNNTAVVDGAWGAHGFSVLAPLALLAAASAP
mmetsp:Transcript_111739/g.310583  ORF Transcript_111739/g.310583 Transcript_111739/m.310583 type:complete len:113 (-) Transcript_111739:265-603(-)